MMGGRGASTGIDTRQFTIDQIIFRNEVMQVRNAADKIRDSMNNIGGVSGGVPSIRKKQCFCCENFTLPASTEYVQCEVCGWIDDPYQNKHTDSLLGKNLITLLEARKQYYERIH